MKDDWIPLKCLQRPGLVDAGSVSHSPDLVGQSKRMEPLFMLLPVKMSALKKGLWVDSVLFLWCIEKNVVLSFHLIYLKLPEEVKACGGLHLLAVQVESQNKHRQDNRGHDL